MVAVGQCILALTIEMIEGAGMTFISFISRSFEKCSAMPQQNGSPVAMMTVPFGFCCFKVLSLGNMGLDHCSMVAFGLACFGNNGKWRLEPMIKVAFDMAVLASWLRSS